MLAGTHILTGAAIYRLSEGKPWWIRWPAVIGGGFLSHYMLDSMASYHDMNAWFHWPMCGFVAIQAFAVGTILLDWRALASGLWAWLSWDWERLAGVNILHGGCSSWAPRYFSECSSNPWTGLWEVALVLGLAILVWRWRDEAADRDGVVQHRRGNGADGHAADGDLWGSGERRV